LKVFNFSLVAIENFENELKMENYFPFSENAEKFLE